LKGTLGPVQIEPGECVKRKEVTFANKRKKKAFFLLDEFLHRFVLVKAFMCTCCLFIVKKRRGCSM